MSVLDRGYSLAEIEEMSTVVESRRGHVEGTARTVFGITDSTGSRPMGQSHVERHLLYQVYLQESWVSACVELIARRVTAGGIDFEPTVDSASEDNRAALMEWFRWVNPGENFRDVCMSAVRGMLIWGDGYWEVDRVNNVPLEVYTLDPLTIDKIADKNGNIASYFQYEDAPGEGVAFKPDEVICFKLGSPRGGLYGLSPTRRLLLPTTIDLFAQSWNRTQMKNGSAGVKSVEMPEGTDEIQGRRMNRYWNEHYAGSRNAGKDVVLWGGAKLSQVGTTPIEMSYLHGRQFTRDEILGVFGVPGHMLGIPEVGTLGGGPATEAQERAFNLNTVEPLQGILLDQINFNIINGATGSFGIKDWRIAFKNPDFRDSMARAREAQIKTDAGVWSINEGRAKSNDGDDRQPVEGGDRNIIAFRGTMVPVDELPQISYVSTQGIQDAGSAEVPSTAKSTVVPEPDKGKNSSSGSKKSGSGGSSSDSSGSSDNTSDSGSTQSMLSALWLWERKALNRVKDGRSALVAFDSPDLPRSLQTEVERQLAKVARTGNPALVRDAFATARRIYEGTHQQAKFVAQRQKALAQRFASWDSDQFDSAADTYLKSGDS